jgi:hypothetical protein
MIGKGAFAIVAAIVVLVKGGAVRRYREAPSAAGDRLGW